VIPEARSAKENALFEAALARASISARVNEVSAMLYSALGSRLKLPSFASTHRTNPSDSMSEWRRA
jgi:hypothetical protein